ncbi:MAG: pyridoxamine 5'-phosphate oxidase family protein, partial [Croceibacterium sp.]
SVLTSCGYGVPLMTLERERPTLIKHHAKADPGEWAGKHKTRRTSIDGLPAKTTDRYIAGDPGTVPAD